MVESQEQVATLDYVDTLEEQEILEALLEAAKPPLPVQEQDLHYLLKTPFRYPPLKWGSRFGRVHEPSIFYGGQKIATTLAESAYYRLVFWYSMDGTAVAESLRSEHTLFSVDYAAKQGVRLNAGAFIDHIEALRHPVDYTHCQSLGSVMRVAGVEAFEYASARDQQGGTCVGLFTPAALTQHQPGEMSAWFCITTASQVSFKRKDASGVMIYPLDDFLYNGVLPFPA
nr:RES family NAD+ phosphorylase [Halomonas olivaria]